MSSNGYAAQAVTYNADGQAELWEELRDGGEAVALSYDDAGRPVALDELTRPGASSAWLWEGDQVVGLAYRIGADYERTFDAWDDDGYSAVPVMRADGLPYWPEQFFGPYADNHFPGGAFPPPPATSWLVGLDRVGDAASLTEQIDTYVSSDVHREILAWDDDAYVERQRRNVGRAFDENHVVTYDAIDRPIRRDYYFSVPYPFSDDPPDDLRWHSEWFEYDDAGRLIGQTRGDPQDLYPRQVVLTFEYDCPSG